MTHVANELFTMNEIRSAILERRDLIRYHRDQKMDDRCWVDDLLVWRMLADTPREPQRPPAFEVAMQICRNYFEHRSAPEADPVPKNAILDSSQWDTDLEKMDGDALRVEFARVQDAIRAHRDAESRTVEHDRALYSVLPEKLPADFRLPSENDFLGEGKAPRAGCPSFWRSHAACKGPIHTIHKWGPCE